MAKTKALAKTEKKILITGGTGFLGKKLAKLADREQKLEGKLQQVADDDEAAINELSEKLEALDLERQEIEREAPLKFSEATKAMATAFLLLYPDGQVRREYRVPRRAPQHGSKGGTGSSADGASPVERAVPPTSDNLSEAQLAVTFTHQALVVREALLKKVDARKRVLALILNEKVRSEALAVRHEANGTTLHAGSDGFASPAFERLQKEREKRDPFAKEHFIEDGTGYEQLRKLSNAQLETLIELLVVECVTAHLQRRTDLVHRLATELKVNVREDWRPDAAWLGGFQKIQLAHLITELRGPVHAPGPDRKKSELVEMLAKLFADAADGKLEDKSLAERVNCWLPLNLREENKAQATLKKEN